MLFFNTDAHDISFSEFHKKLAQNYGTPDVFIIDVVTKKQC